MDLISREEPDLSFLSNKVTSISLLFCFHLALWAWRAGKTMLRRSSQSITILSWQLDRRWNRTSQELRGITLEFSGNGQSPWRTLAASGLALTSICRGSSLYLYPFIYPPNHQPKYLHFGYVSGKDLSSNRAQIFLSVTSTHWIGVPLKWWWRRGHVYLLKVLVLGYTFPVLP